MPAPVIAAIIAGGAGLGAAAISSKSAGNAAKQQTTAANYAADVQGKANTETLAFQREQSAQDQARFEATQRANYDQYLNHYRAAQQLGNEMGFHLPDAQPYVPVSQGAPAAGAAATGPAAPGASASGSVPPPPKDLSTAIAEANRIAYGGVNKHNDPNYWAAMWQKDPGYTWERLLGKGAGGADVAKAGPFAGAGMASAAASTPMSSGATFARPIAAYLNPAMGGGAPPPPSADFRLRGINAYL